MKQVEIFSTSNNKIQIEAKFDDDTVWLTLNQMVELFKSSKQNISYHTNQIFKDKELVKKGTVKKYLTVQNEGKRLISREVEYYNLDVIISVGYRVKSKNGVLFRQWATLKLKEYFTKSRMPTDIRLPKEFQQLQEFSSTIQKIQLISNSDQIKLEEVKGLLEIVSNYSQSFILLNRFDGNQLETEKLDENITYEIKYNEAIKAVQQLKKELLLKKEASELFGNQKDDSFAGILGSIVQTFDGAYLYKSIEEQASHLLYFVIKNHPFSDGNKRIGAFLFVWFLEKNRHRFKKSGELKINDNALVALALLVAQSNPSDKEIMIKLIINLIKS